jgi:hypothetical protein
MPDQEAREPQEHPLKTWPAPFAAIMEGRKRHEFRRDDRGFRTGDTLVLKEWDPAGDPELGGAFTGRKCRVRVTYISRGPMWGIPDGYVVMSIDVGLAS